MKTKKYYAIPPDGCSDLLTPGMPYEILSEYIPGTSLVIRIVADCGDAISVLVDNSYYLNGGCFEIIEDAFPDEPEQQNVEQIAKETPEDIRDEFIIDIKELIRKYPGRIDWELTERNEHVHASISLDLLSNEKD